MVVELGSRRSRRADSTRVEIVSPRRAASSRSRTMTRSSMISVVFIWKTIQREDLSSQTHLSGIATRQALAGDRRNPVLAG
jgi:hypothetical protein